MENRKVKKELTLDDAPQITFGKGIYRYCLFVLEAGQTIRWGRENRYYSTGPGVLEVEFSNTGMKTTEYYLDDPAA